MNKTERYPFAVYATAFHGGRLISRHKTEAAAERAVRKFRMTDCICGCAGIINEGAGEKPGTRSQQDQYSDPYAIGAI